MRKLGWGVIGAGGIADRRTIPEGIMPAENARLVAVSDADPVRGAAVGQKYGAKVYPDLDQLLADPEVEALYIATPNFLHKEHTLRAAAAGKHVLCEKPLGLSLDQAREMAKACKAAGVKLGAGFMMRFNPYHQHFKNLVDQGTLGTIVFARAQLTCWYPPIPGAWRQDPKCSGGGALMDLTVHCVDLLEMILGPAGEVMSYVEQRVHDYPCDDTNALLIKFQNGTFGFVDCAFNIPDEASENVLELQGTKGCIKARMTIGQGPSGIVQVCSLEDAGGYNAAQARSGGSYQPLELEPKNTYRAEIEAFSRAVVENTQPPVGAEAGVRSMQVVEAVIRASKTGCAQKL